MTGKEKCRILRDVRRKAAELNEIEYNFKECTHEGPCKGVCAFCDNELRELEALIEERRAEGLPVYMEYMFAIPAPEMPASRETFGARLRKMLTRAKTEKPEPPEEMLLGMLAPAEFERMERERSEEHVKEALERLGKAEILSREEIKPADSVLIPTGAIPAEAKP